MAQATAQATAALASQTAAATSAQSAQGYSVSAGTSASTATSQAASASTSAASASNSATAAASSATSASSSATSASTSASNSSTSATNASNSATAAAGSASSASTYATNAANSATAAANSASSAAATLASALVKTNNLADLSNASTARTNLGVAIGSNVQAWDADLDAIAAISSTSGLLKKTAANTWSLDTTSYLSGTLGLSQGGTGATDAAGARTALGLGTAATAAATSFLQTANNLSDVTASTARSNLGLGSAATLASSAVLQSANNLSDLASVSSARTTLGLTALATTTPGTGVATALGVNTGTAGAFVVNGGALGTPASGNLANCTFPTLNQNTTGTAAGLSATLAVSSGGTGLTSLTAGYIPFGGSTTYGSDSSLFWDNTNKRLGVGTASPISKFTVISGSGSTLAQLNIGYNGSSNYYDADNHFFRNAAQTGQVTIDSAQRITAGALSVSTGSSPNIAALYTGYGGSVNYYDANTHIYRNGSSTETMRITAGGMVGIGTTSPSYPLDVTATNTSSQLRLYGTTGSQLEMWNAASDSASRNWALLCNQMAYGDFGIYQSNALGGNPRTASTGRLYISSGGLVGIGTSSPATLFHVNGGRSSFVANSEQYAISVGYASAGAYYLGANSSNNALLFSNSGGATMATLDASGNLGLGVTPSAWGVGYKAFQLQGGVSLYNNETNSFLSLAQNIFVNSVYENRYIASAAATRYRQSAGAHIWDIAPSGTAGNPISFTQAMTLDASGRLGIGSATPAGTRLYVNGGSLFTGSPGSYGVGISGSLTSGRIGTYSTNSAAIINTYFDDSTIELSAGVTSGYVTGISITGRSGSAYGDTIRFVTRGTGTNEAARIDSSGNVGIGTTAPNYKLDVAGLINTTDQFRSSGGGGDLRVNGNFDGNLAAIGLVGANPLMFFTNNTERARIDANGNIEVKNSASVPSSNPSGGGVLYVEGGALKYRGSSGTVTTIANA